MCVFIFEMSKSVVEIQIGDFCLQLNETAVFKPVIYPCLSLSLSSNSFPGNSGAPRIAPFLHWHRVNGAQFMMFLRMSALPFPGVVVKLSSPESSQLLPLLLPPLNAIGISSMGLSARQVHDSRMVWFPQMPSSCVK